MNQDIVTSAYGAVLVGAGATLVMDVWAQLQKRAFGVSSLDYRFVGRWIGYSPKGKFAHDAIGKAAPLPGEALLGWEAHYLIGILFAIILVAVWGAECLGAEWLRHRRLRPLSWSGSAALAHHFLSCSPDLASASQLLVPRSPDCPLSQPDRAYFLWNRALRLRPVLRAGH